MTQRTRRENVNLFVAFCLGFAAKRIQRCNGDSAGANIPAVLQARTYGRTKAWAGDVVGL